MLGQGKSRGPRGLRWVTICGSGGLRFKSEPAVAWQEVVAAAGLVSSYLIGSCGPTIRRAREGDRRATTGRPAGGSPPWMVAGQPPKPAHSRRGDIVQPHVFEAHRA
jgi:hypothetical protein